MSDVGDCPRVWRRLLRAAGRQAGTSRYEGERVSREEEGGCGVVLASKKEERVREGKARWVRGEEESRAADELVLVARESGVCGLVRGCGCR